MIGHEIDAHIRAGTRLTFFEKLRVQWVLCEVQARRKWRKFVVKIMIAGMSSENLGILLDNFDDLIGKNG